MPEDRVEEHKMADPLGVRDGERDGVGSRGVVTDEYRSTDVELVEQSLQLGGMFFQRESPEVGALGSAVALPIEGDRSSRAQQRQEPLVDVVIVGEAVHEDDRRIVTGDLLYEESAVRRLDEPITRSQGGFSHRSMSFQSFVGGISEASHTLVSVWAKSSRVGERDPRLVDRASRLGATARRRRNRRGCSRLCSWRRSCRGHLTSARQ